MSEMRDADDFEELVDDLLDKERERISRLVAEEATHFAELARDKARDAVITEYSVALAVIAELRAEQEVRDDA